MVELEISITVSIPCVWVAYPLLFCGRVKGKIKGQAREVGWKWFDIWCFFFFHQPYRLRQGGGLLLYHFGKVSLAVLTLSSAILCIFGAFVGLYVFGLENVREGVELIVERS